MNLREINQVNTTCITEREIASQPAVWSGFAGDLARTAADIRAWIAERAPEEIWLCGAGSSAYIGETVTARLAALTGIRHRAIATTTLVSSPADLIVSGRNVLVVSVGRSGDSSETIGVLDVLDRHMSDADRLNITCNAASALARRTNSGVGEQRTIVLPEGAHDQGFAMTASFTTMLLTVLACLHPAPVAGVDAMAEMLAARARDVLVRAEALWASRLNAPPARAVFLGSGPLAGIARESALKVLELSRGRIVTVSETSLGFRHGPKAVVDEGTLVVAHVSVDPHTSRYDLDLVDEVRRQFGANRVVTIGPAGTGADLAIEPVGDDAWNAVLYVLLPQLLAARWGRALGIPIDNPFEGGELNRVVAGVRLYAYGTGGDVWRH